MTITRIDEYTSRDTVAALRELLERAEAGRLRGFVFSVKTGPKRHTIGVTGEYWHDPQEALGSVSRMAYRVNQLISARSGESATDFMPLN